jgi:hypothetical protein
VLLKGFPGWTLGQWEGLLLTHYFISLRLGCAFRCAVLETIRPLSWDEGCKECCGWGSPSPYFSVKSLE